MSEQPTGPEQQPDPNQGIDYDKRAKTNKRIFKWLGIPTAVVLLLVIVSVAVDSGSDDDKDDDKSNHAPATPADEHSTTEAPATPEDIELEPDDFDIDVVTTDQKCFGSAGCNVTFEIDVNFEGDITEGQIPASKVIYEVDGTNDPVISSFELSEGSAEFQSTEQSAQIPSADSELTAKVTKVITRE